MQYPLSDIYYSDSRPVCYQSQIFLAYCLSVSNTPPRTSLCMIGKYPAHDSSHRECDRCKRCRNAARVVSNLGCSFGIYPARQRWKVFDDNHINLLIDIRFFDISQYWRTVTDPANPYAASLHAFGCARVFPESRKQKSATLYI